MLKNRFYMTYARSRHNIIVPFAERHNIGLMTNAAHRWSDSTNNFKDLWEYNLPHIVDSGGYNIQVNFREYPWSVEDYHNWLSQYKDGFEWCAIMDYACEKRFDEIHSVKERMDKTLENTIKHFELDPNYNILPILQGRSINAYLEFYDSLVDYGIPVSDLGVGTICRISSNDKIIETENKIRNECNKVERLHGFGVKVDSYSRGVTFDSADSQAWVYPASNGKCYLRNGNGLESVDMGDNSKKRTVLSFINYYDYVTSLNPKFKDSDIQIELFNLDLEKTGDKYSINQIVKDISELFGIEPKDPPTKKWLQKVAKGIVENNIHKEISKDN